MLAADADVIYFHVACLLQLPAGKEKCDAVATISTI